MKTFTIDDTFWALFPDAEIGVVIARSIDNGRASDEKIVAALKAANEQASSHLPNPNFSDNTVIAVWREAFQKFKTKKGARSSIESLLKRASKGSEVSSISPLVDLYNTVSLTYALPCGGEDIDTFEGNLRLTQTMGGDTFRALGDENDSETLPGEICYLDDAGAVCRCWNWRDGVRTMLTEQTENAFLILESVDPTRHDDLEAALARLAEATEIALGGVAKVFLLTRDNPTITIE